MTENKHLSVHLVVNCQHFSAMKTFGVLVLSLFLSVVYANNTWGLPSHGVVSSAIHFDHLSNPNYVRAYITQMLRYAQYLAQRQQQEHQKQTQDFLSNRVRGFDLDEDRIVFVNTQLEDNDRSKVSPGNVLSSSPARPQVVVPTATSKIPIKEETPETTTRVTVSSSTQAVTEDQSVNAIPTGPSRCVWAIVSCCTPRSNTVRHQCFEILGCQGAFWDNSPCEGRITQSAAKVALDFYSKG